MAGWTAAAAWEGNRFSVRSAAATQLSHSGSSYSLPLQPDSTQLSLYHIVIIILSELVYLRFDVNKENNSITLTGQFSPKYATTAHINT